MVEAGIGIAHIRGRCKRLRFPWSNLFVKTLVSEIGEIQHTITDYVVAATILVNAGASVKRRRSEITKTTAI
jgi:hypothetical protein